jgi:hypothetical protein
MIRSIPCGTEIFSMPSFRMERRESKWRKKKHLTHSAKMFCVFLKTENGTTKVVENCSGKEKVKELLEKHYKSTEEGKESKFIAWCNYREFLFAGKNIKRFFDNTLEEVGLGDCSTISILPGSAVYMSKSYDIKAKRVRCGITQELTDDPVVLNPGCLHAFDRIAIQKWLKIKMVCPVCNNKLETTPMKNLVEKEF